MITCVFRIHEGEGGIAFHQVPINPGEGTPLERRMAGLFDLGLQLTGEAIMRAVHSGIAIEGAVMRDYVSKSLKEIGVGNLDQELKDMGYITDESPR